MSKTSEIVEPVIDLVLDAINLEEDNLEDPNTTSVPGTMSQTDIPTMEEEDNEIQQLLDEKREIQNQINEINKKKEINTEKNNHSQKSKSKSKGHWQKSQRNLRKEI